MPCPEGDATIDRSEPHGLNTVVVVPCTVTWLGCIPGVVGDHHWMELPLLLPPMTFISATACGDAYRARIYDCWTIAAMTKCGTQVSEANTRDAQYNDALKAVNPAIS